MRNTLSCAAIIGLLVSILTLEGCSIAIPKSQYEIIEKFHWNEIGEYSLSEVESWQTFHFSNKYSDIVIEVGEPWGPHHMVSVYSCGDIVGDDNLAMPYHAHGCPWNVIACIPTKQTVSEVRIFPIRNTSLLMRLDISNLLIVDNGQICPATYKSGIIKLSVCQVDGDIWSWVYEHPILQRRRLCNGSDELTKKFHHQN
ncbi:MAG: hypothetical protein IJU44_06930 [Kiritimatiellae bacterium]|nr:hypothetical protein [Kiritimatiellia bacterium]